MNENTFDQNLLRTIASILWTRTLMDACQEMFQKSYLLASPNERNTVEKLVFDHIGSNYSLITEQYLAGQKQNPVGFQAPPQNQSQNSPGQK